MSDKLKELVEHIEDWPDRVQEEAIASLEAIAWYVSLYESSCDDC